MAGKLQPLDQKFQIADASGKPTEYFIRWAQQRQIDIGTSITLGDLETYLEEHMLQEGSGIQFTPDGNLANSPLIEAQVQEILDQITNIHGSILFRGALEWEELAPGTAGFLLSTSGPGADPTWIAASGGGGVTFDYYGMAIYRPNLGAAFGAGSFGCRAIFFPFACNIYSIATWVTVANATVQFRPGVYAITATGTIGALLATGPQVTGATFGLNVIPLTAPLAVAAGTVLWVGCQIAVSAVTLANNNNADTAFFASAGALANPAPGATYSGACAFWVKLIP